ncbi:hypothetical protein DFJ73DRAFT_829049 [Zopfochytrium polystomum]|nr:hypothetical protein DFJ73DRAFT_829049 [Zopfochytrium polystomum]
MMPAGSFVLHAATRALVSASTTPLPLPPDSQATPEPPSAEEPSALSSSSSLPSSLPSRADIPTTPQSDARSLDSLKLTSSRASRRASRQLQQQHQQQQESSHPRSPTPTRHTQDPLALPSLGVAQRGAHVSAMFPSHTHSGHRSAARTLDSTPPPGPVEPLSSDTLAGFQPGSQHRPYRPTTKSPQIMYQSVLHPAATLAQAPSSPSPLASNAATSSPRVLSTPEKSAGFVPGVGHPHDGLRHLGWTPSLSNIPFSAGLPPLTEIASDAAIPVGFIHEPAEGKFHTNNPQSQLQSQPQSQQQITNAITMQPSTAGYLPQQSYQDEQDLVHDDDPNDQSFGDGIQVIVPSSAAVSGDGAGSDCEDDMSGDDLLSHYKNFLDTQHSVYAKSSSHCRGDNHIQAVKSPKYSANGSFELLNLYRAHVKTDGSLAVKLLYEPKKVLPFVKISRGAKSVLKWMEAHHITAFFEWIHTNVGLQPGANESPEASPAVVVDIPSKSDSAPTSKTSALKGKRGRSTERNSDQSIEISADARLQAPERLKLFEGTPVAAPYMPAPLNAQTILPASMLPIAVQSSLVPNAMGQINSRPTPAFEPVGRLNPLFGPIFPLGAPAQSHTPIFPPIFAANPTPGSQTGFGELDGSRGANPTHQTPPFSVQSMDSSAKSGLGSTMPPDSLPIGAAARASSGKRKRLDPNHSLEKAKRSAKHPDRATADATGERIGQIYPSSSGTVDGTSSGAGALDPEATVSEATVSEDFAQSSSNTASYGVLEPLVETGDNVIDAPLHRVTDPNLEQSAIVAEVTDSDGAPPSIQAHDGGHDSQMEESCIACVGDVSLATAGEIPAPAPVESPDADVIHDSQEALACTETIAKATATAQIDEENFDSNKATEGEQDSPTVEPTLGKNCHLEDTVPSTSSGDLEPTASNVGIESATTQIGGTAIPESEAEQSGSFGGFTDVLTSMMSHGENLVQSGAGFALLPASSPSLKEDQLASEDRDRVEPIDVEMVDVANDVGAESQPESTAVNAASTSPDASESEASLQPSAEVPEADSSSKSDSYKAIDQCSTTIFSGISSMAEDCSENQTMHSPVRDLELQVGMDTNESDKFTPNDGTQEMSADAVEVFGATANVSATEIANVSSAETEPASPAASGTLETPVATSIKSVGHDATESPARNDRQNVAVKEPLVALESTAVAQLDEGITGMLTDADHPLLANEEPQAGDVAHQTALVPPAAERPTLDEPVLPLAEVHEEQSLTTPPKIEKQVIIVPSIRGELRKIIADLRMHRDTLLSLGCGEEEDALLRSLTFGVNSDMEWPGWRRG